MATSTDVLLVTANVGTLFEKLSKIQDGWLQELYTTVDKYQPRFVAMHFQEVGGKNYKANMASAETFFKTIESRLSDFDRVCVYIDSDFKTEDNFTALGNIYFIHKSLENVQQYDFSEQKFTSVSGRNTYTGSFCGVTTVKKEKFQRAFWPDQNWSRKGYMKTRWMIHNQALDLVNVHLFHDASNLKACESEFSVFSKNRHNALKYVIGRIFEGDLVPVPYFLFGDFNFRLDTKSLIQDLSTSTEMTDVKNDITGEVEKIVYNGSKDVLFKIGTKKFVDPHNKLFKDGTGQELRKYDKETEAFKEITEEKIFFPPSYPYSEDPKKPTEYMTTRCPSWCDRILMSHSAEEKICRKSDAGKNTVYNIIGPNVCMGDHKPVFLFFALQSNVQ